jgi:septal ring factor EnvC (AmiA/AmiB activator)
MKRQTRIAFSLLAALGGVLVLAGGAGAQDIGALEARIASAQADAEGLAAEIDATSDEVAAAQAEAQAAAAREAELTATLEEGQARLAELEQRVAEAEAALEEARARLGRALDVLSARLVAMYKGDMPDATALILEADGFDDLTTRAEYLEMIEDADADLVARVRALREEVAGQLAAVEDARAEQEAFNAQLETARAEIAAARAAAEARASELAAVRDQQASQLATLRSSVGEWTAQVEQLQAEQAAAAEAAAAEQAAAEEAAAAEQPTPADAQQEVAGWVGDYAIPEAIVMCESGGSYEAVNPDSGAGGAYQILPSTWEMYGGEGDPQDASPAEQDQVASEIWADSGSSAWECAN